MPRTKKNSLPLQKPFPLLELPPELRNYIWEYVVVKDRAIVLWRPHQRARVPESRLRSGNFMKHHQEDDERRRQSTRLAVAFTCRQIYLEVTPIYYGKNTYRPKFSGFGCGFKIFEDFADAIGERNTRAITKVPTLIQIYCRTRTFDSSGNLLRTPYKTSRKINYRYALSPLDLSLPRL